METQTTKLISREIAKADWLEARFLSEDEQTKYEYVCKRFNLDKARNSLNVPLQGSNLFKVLLLNQEGIRTATLPELECALENGMDLKGTYEDAPSVILRSKGDSYAPNDSLAKDLARKLKLRSFKTPKIITGLRIIEDEDSDYGLSFDIKDAQIIEAPDFDSKNHERKFLKINPDYSIEFNDAGKRTFYVKNDGLSRLYLGRNSSLDSDCSDLAGSSSYGRVVVVSAKGASQKFLESKLSDLQRDREQVNAEFETRYLQAKSVLEKAYEEAQSIMKRK